MATAKLLNTRVLQQTRESIAAMGLQGCNYLFHSSHPYQVYLACKPKPKMHHDHDHHSYSTGDLN
jgi:hypothetical protein